MIGAVAIIGPSTVGAGLVAAKVAIAAKIIPIVTAVKTSVCAVSAKFSVCAGAVKSSVVAKVSAVAAKIKAPFVSLIDGYQNYRDLVKVYGQFPLF